MRLAVDTGGTFTDLVVETDAAAIHLYKAPTTPADPTIGVMDVLNTAARDTETSLGDLLAGCTAFVHGTTRAINAILTNTTARTAFLTTKGHRDILVFREGGRTEPFNFRRPFPEPYVPRSLSFEVPERVGAQGDVVLALDEDAVVEIIDQLKVAEVEAVAVCLLWSMLHPEHERRIGALLDEHAPDLPYTLSHRLNPTIREYRRASSTAIDASLKPIMTGYLRGLDQQLRAAGFGGRMLVVTSSGGVLDAATIADTPIHAINSGPAMAPVAGRFYAMVDGSASTAIVADTGGTSYDVSLVRRGNIPTTRETWLGLPYSGHMTGFASVDVKSIGAGGGSIAWVDDGGLLHVGPESAGADPGPACYARGGDQPTVTDASLVLGYIDDANFLGGEMALDPEAAETAIVDHIATPLGLDAREASAAVIRLTTQHMVQAIEEITIDQGIDPREAVLIGGGGAAGLNAVAIGRRLGTRRVVVPETGATLSAVGALLSDLIAEHSATLVTTSSEFDFAAVNTTLADLEQQCRAFFDGPGAGAVESSIEYEVEARYPHQVWEITVPLSRSRFESEKHVEELRQAFHANHDEIFATSDPNSEIEIVGWRARARCRLREAEHGRLAGRPSAPVPASRLAYFEGAGLLKARVVQLDDLSPRTRQAGPAIVESSFTTVVIDPGATVERMPSGSLVIAPWAEFEPDAKRESLEQAATP